MSGFEFAEMVRQFFQPVFFDLNGSASETLGTSKKGLVGTRTVGIYTSNIIPVVTDARMVNLSSCRISRPTGIPSKNSEKRKKKREPRVKETNADLMRQRAIEEIEQIDRRARVLPQALPEAIRPGEEIVVEIARVAVGGREGDVEVPLADDDLIGSVQEGAVGVLPDREGQGGRDIGVAAVVALGVVAEQEVLTGCVVSPGS